MEYFQVFVFLVYILYKSLQDGNDINKFKQCSRIGVYLGQYHLHYRNFSMVLDPDNMKIIPP